MRKQNILICVLVILPFLVVGCVVNPEQVGGDLGQMDTSDPCIDADDVTAIPTGSAVGSDLSGQYEIVSGFTRSCEECGQHTVADPCTGGIVIVEEGTVGSIVQEDGSLSILDSEGEELVGGIDDDGSSSVATIVPARDSQGEINGQVFVLFEGRFVGDRILVDATFHVNANESNGVIDFVFINEVVYERTN